MYLKCLNLNNAQFYRTYKYEKLTEVHHVNLVYFYFNSYTIYSIW